jgi:hypothetical protein
MDEDALMATLDILWITTHGAPRDLIISGESGITASEKTNRYLGRKGIKIHPRAKDQRARFVGRRGARVRDAIRKIESQINEEGLAGIRFSSIFADAVFAGNALLSVNGSSTPYNAARGRAPRILPSIDQVDAPHEARVPSPGLIRHTHRMREISVRAMIEGSARARLGCAVNARTTIASRKLEPKNGGEVDFYPRPSTKDDSGWYGPATVIDIQRATRGIISNRWQLRIFPSAKSAKASSRQSVTFSGILFDHLSQDCRLIPPFRLDMRLARINGSQFRGAADLLDSSAVYLPNVMSARIGLGVGELPQVDGFAGSVVLLGQPGRRCTQTIELDGTHRDRIERLPLRVEYPTHWRHL